MDVTALKYFIVVAQTQHMSRAAQKLNITQPSLSTSIRRLEAEIGFELFDRSGRGIQLNEYGRIFLDGVMQMENIMDSCLSEMERLRQSSVNFVRLACSNSPGNSRLIDLLLARGINLKVENIPRDWETELLSKTCDMVITVAPLHKKKISGVELRTQTVVIAASETHPLAKKSSVTLEDLERYPFCSTDAPYSLINVLTSLHPELDFHPRITFLGRNSGDMVKAIHTDRHIGLMVKRNLPADDGIKILPVENFDIKLPLHLYWRTSDSGNALLMTIKEKIVEFYKGMGD